MIVFAALFVIGITVSIVGLFRIVDETLDRRGSIDQAHECRSLYVSPSGRTVSPWVERSVTAQLYANGHHGAGRFAVADKTNKF